MPRNVAIGLMASALTLFATSASAQQGTVPNFAGPYIGALVGFGSHNVSANNPIAGEFKDTDTKVTAGGYVGYSWVFANCFFGVETDFNFLNTSPTGVDIEFGPTGLTEVTNYNSSLDWYGTLRGRAGFLVLDNWLLYGTGGLAYAKVNHTLTDNCVGCGNSAFNLGTFGQSNSSTKTGWTAGGGTEFAINPNWLVRAEALFIDLGGKDRTYVIVTPLATGTLNANWNDQFWVGRFGVTYAFDMP